MAQNSTPAVVSRYFEAAEADDAKALAACFTEDGTVVDEGVTYRGRDEIIRWRDELASKWIYTTTMLGSEPISDTAYRVTERVDGNFPGGTTVLGYDFDLADDLIAALRIG